MIESYIKTILEKKKILLMTHIVLGYPSFEDSYKIIAEMVKGGVDLMELQIPFSEPIADGPVILHANQESLEGGSTVQKCFDFADRVTREFNIPFLFMSYYNILFKYKVDRFVNKMAEIGIKGAIVPDLPPEEGKKYIDTMGEKNLDPIFIFSPTTTSERMKYIASHGKGFIYCVARKGVTGADTTFTNRLDDYLSSCRKATDLPLALGFGVKDKADIDFLKGKADIAVLGSQTIRLIKEEGVQAVGGFIKSLR